MTFFENAQTLAGLGVEILYISKTTQQSKQSCPGPAGARLRAQTLRSRSGLGDHLGFPRLFPPELPAKHRIA